MKIAQIDYQAIMSANAAQAAANQSRIANTQQGQNNLMIEANTYFTDRRIGDQRNIQSAKRFRDAMGIVGNAITLSANLATMAIETKRAKDGEAAGQLLTDQAGALTERINGSLRTGTDSYFDADDNIVRPEQWQEWYDTDRKAIEDSGWSDSVKEEALKNLDQMYDTAWQDIYGQLYEAETTAMVGIFDNKLEEAAKLDTMAGTTSIGEELIDNTSWLTPSQKEEQKAKYRTSTTARINTNQVTAIASGAEGLPAALDYIDTLQVDDTNKETLRQLARTVSTGADSDAVTQATEYVSQQLATGVSPAVLMQELEPQLEAMSEERREKVEAAIKPLVAAQANKDMGITGDIGTMTTPEIYDALESIRDNGEAAYAGIPEFRKSAEASLIGELERRGEEQEELNKEQLKLSKEAMEYAYNLYMNEGYSGESVIRMIEGYATVPGTDEDDNTAFEFIEKVKGTLPTGRQLLVDTYIDDFKATYRQYRKDMGDENPSPEVSAAVADAQGRILDLFRYLGGENVSDKLIEDTMAGISDAYMGPMIEALGSLEEDIGDQTLSRDARFGVDNGFLKEGEELFDQTRGMVHYDPDSGRYAFTSQFAERFYTEVAGIVTQEAAPMLTTDQTVASITPRTNADGDAVPIPVVTFSSGQSFTIHNGNLAKVNADGSYRDIHPIRSVEHSVPETPEQKERFNALGSYMSGQLGSRDYASEVDKGLRKLMEENG